MAKPTKNDSKEIDTPDETEKKAFSIERSGGHWSFVEVTYRGADILRVERTVPDLKAVAIERFKIMAFKYWSTLG